MDKNNLTDGLKAIIIADPFRSSFGKYQEKYPACLLPICSEPIISYTIEFLVLNRISEVYIIAHEHKKEISDFIDSQKHTDISIKVIKHGEVPSVSSAIKDLDSRDLIKGDFLILNGFIVSNIDISDALKEHKTRKQNEEPMLITKIFTKLPFDSNLRHEETVVVFNDANNELLKYEVMKDKKSSKINQFFEYKPKKHQSLSVRMDLVDTSIDIVSASIIGILGDSDNYEQFKEEFINHVNESEIITDKIFYSLTKGVSYFSHINSPASYYQTNLDVLSSKPYPLIPGAHLSNVELDKESEVKLTENLAKLHLEGSVFHDEKVKITKNLNLKLSKTDAKLVITQQDDIFEYPLGDGTGDDQSEESDLMSEETDEDDTNTGITFEEEIRQIVMRQITEGHKIESIKIEINSVRFSVNKSLIDCLVCIVPVLVENVMSQEGIRGIAAINQLEIVFQDYSELLKSFIITKNDQAHLIECIERCCIDEERLHNGFHCLLQMLYKSQLITGEAVLEWSEAKIDNAHNLRSNFMSLCAPFIKYLKDKANESSDDSSEGEESEESD